MSIPKRNRKYKLKNKQLPEYSMGGNILSGALSGAASGAAVAPPWGAVAGFVAGIGMGVKKGVDERNQLEQQETEERNNFLRQKRLGEYQASPGYTSVYAAYGAEVPPTPSTTLEKNAYYNAVLDELWNSGVFDTSIRDKAPTDFKERQAYAADMAKANSKTFVNLSDIQKHVPWADPTILGNIIKSNSGSFGIDYRGGKEPKSTGTYKIGYRSMLGTPTNVDQYYESADSTKPSKEQVKIYDPVIGFEDLDVTNSPVPQYEGGGLINQFKKRIYDTVSPRGYSDDLETIKGQVGNFILNKSRPSEGDYREELWAKDLGVIDNMNNFYKSSFAPGKAKNPELDYYALKNVNKESFLYDTLYTLNRSKEKKQKEEDRINRWSFQSPSKLENYFPQGLAPEDKSEVAVTHEKIPLTEVNKGLKQSTDTYRNSKKLPSLPSGVFKNTDALGYYTVFQGEDDNGKYVGYYDKWDFANPMLNAITNPTEVYDRVYYKENPNYKRFSVDNPNKYITYNPYVERHAFGGMQGAMPQQGLVQPNAEVEGGETVETPSGQDLAVQGPSHAQGGVQTFLPPGSKVYSDRLKNPLTGNTFADDHAALSKQITKQEKKLYDKDKQLTRLEKDTLELNIKNLEKKQDQLFKIQQSMNNNSKGQQGPQMNMPGQSPQGMPNMPLNGPQMASQGPSAYPQQPQFPFGGYAGLYGGKEGNQRQWIDYNPAMNWDNTMGADLLTSNPMYKQGMYSYEPNKYYNPKLAPARMPAEDITAEAANNAMDLQWAKDYASSSSTIPKAKPTFAFDSPEYQGADQIGTGADFDKMLGEAENAKVSSGFDMGKIGGYLNTAATVAPMLWDIGKGLFGKPEKFKPSYNYAGMVAAANIKDRKYNIDPMLQANRSAYATAVRNYAGRSRGEQLAGMTSLLGAKSKMDAAAYAQKQNMEDQNYIRGNQLAANVGQFNAAARERAKVNTQMDEANINNFMSEGLTGLSRLASQRNVDTQQREMEGIKMKTLYSLFGGLGDTAYGKLLEEIQNANINRNYGG